jgi:hypothetical protein
MIKNIFTYSFLFLILFIGCSSDEAVDETDTTQDSATDIVISEGLGKPLKFLFLTGMN